MAGLNGGNVKFNLNYVRFELLNLGRLNIASCSLGAAQMSLDLAIEHVKVCFWMVLCSVAYNAYSRFGKHLKKRC